MTNEELALAYQQGNKAALSTLWEQTKRLIYKFCHAFYNRNADRCTTHGVVLEDLLQEGFFALIQAASAYKADKEYKFTSYLNYPLKNRFHALTGLRTNLKEDSLNMSTSLNIPIQQAEGEPNMEMGELFADSECESVMDNLEMSFVMPALSKDLESAIKQLEPIEQCAIRGRYYEGKTLNALAEAEGTTRERIRQAETKGLRGLRRPDLAEKLKPYITELDSFAYYGVRFSTWKHGGSVQERLIEKYSAQ